jgi:hypothetical protein
MGVERGASRVRDVDSATQEAPVALLVEERLDLLIGLREG